MELVHAIRRQAEACMALGSPMYAGLLGRVADDVAAVGRCAEALAGFEQTPGPSAVALRLVGAVHKLVLTGDAPGLAGFYPSVGGHWDLARAWPAFIATLTAGHDRVRNLLGQAPQTNEVGRAAALTGGLLHVAAAGDLPIRLFEVGASGGLNLRADRFRYLRTDGSSWGPADSPVVLDPAWQGAALPDAELRIVERLGSDIAPIDVDTEDGRLTLLSYVWPDQAARLARLRGAFEVAEQVPAQVVRADAARFVRGIRLQAGTTTVLWHSVMWQYLGADDQARVTDRIDQLAEQATRDRPFAHLRLEPTRRTPDAEHEFLMLLDMHPGEGRRVLGAAAPHGVPAVWE